MRKYLCRRRLFYRLAIFSAIVLIGLALLTGHISPRLIIRDLGYLTRPLWDTNLEIPETVVAHFYSDKVPIEQLCSLHGWEVRNKRVNVIDAVIFSVELDILEIRLRELWDVVDKFVVMETDITFTGKVKPLYLHDNLDRFKWAEEKLIVVSLCGKLNEHPKSEFENENQMRRKMAEEISNLLPENGDLIIVGDVDEIPYKHTIQLLQTCTGYPRDLHLFMRNYMYSFEFYVDSNHWRPHVTQYDSNFMYHHGKKPGSSHILADAGWHCSFCFKYLSDFIFKMTSYSHNDRVTAAHLIVKENIQQKICDGANIFDMYPEAYTYKELFSTIGNIPKIASTIGIPNSVLEFRDKFRFLLPGGCRREDLP